jgi:hypothetical protein
MEKEEKKGSWMDIGRKEGISEEEPPEESGGREIKPSYCTAN